MGKLIVIDGLDGSGKQTQADRLAHRLEQEGIPVKAVHFPDYDQPSGQVVREYLDGKLGGLEDVNAYSASSLYAVDRYASYRKYWRQDYLSDTVILADRYVSSNVIHQMSKLPKEQWESFGKWLTEYEYTLLELPMPDAVFYLDVELEVSRSLLKQRYKDQQHSLDLHEQNMAYLLKCRECAQYAAEQFSWDWIFCCQQGAMLPVDSIGEILYQKVKALL